MVLRQSIASRMLGEPSARIGWPNGEADIWLKFLFLQVSTLGARPVYSDELNVIDNGVMDVVAPAELVASVPRLVSVFLLLVSI